MLFKKQRANIMTNK